MKKPILALLTIQTLATLALTACDNSPVEKIKAVTSGESQEDKYPIANMPDEPLATPLEINIEPKVVAMTNTMTVAVKQDGTLWTWGTDTMVGTTYTPQQVPNIDNVKAVSASRNHILILKKDGTVWGWGINGDGQINPNIESSMYKPIGLQQVPDMENVVDISAGLSTSLFVNNEGFVYMLGKNDFGLVNGNTGKLKEPTKIEGFKNIIRIEGDLSAILALNRDGVLFSTGLRFEQTGVKSEKIISDNSQGFYFKPTQISFNKKVVDFSEGFGNFALLEDGTLWSWGTSINGDTAQGETSKDFELPTKVKGLNQVVAINSNSASTKQGDLYVWGRYSVQCSTCMSTGSSVIKLTQPVKIKNNLHIIQFAKGSRNDVAVDKYGNLWFWSTNRDGVKGTGETQPNEEMPLDYYLTPQKSLFNVRN